MRFLGLFRRGIVPRADLITVLSPTLRTSFQTATDQAPAIPLNIPSNTYLVSARVGNFQYSLTAPYGVPVDQLWVR